MNILENGTKQENYRLSETIFDISVAIENSFNMFQKMYNDYFLDIKERKLKLQNETELAYIDTMFHYALGDLFESLNLLNTIDGDGRSNE